MICRAAVPFFLIASGYFVRSPTRIALRNFTHPITKLAPIYIFWMITYYAVAGFTNVAPLKIGMMDLVSGGTAFHLWYIPAAASSLILVPVGISLIGTRATGILCALLAMLALSLGPYHDLFQFSSPPRRGGLLLAPSYVFIGYMIHLWQPKISIFGAAIFIIFGILSLLVEEIMLSHLSHQPIISHDFIMMTYVYGSGCFLLARAIPNGTMVRRIANFGSLSLGIYVSQLLFLWIFRSIFEVNDAIEMARLAVFSFASAALLTAALHHFKIFRPIIG